jgi:serine/threonine protein kinase
MQNFSPSLMPSSLPPGTPIGSWRVLSRCDSGSFGTVYRAEKVGSGVVGLFALKLATSPKDPRFKREGVLLSRIHHPLVPRLHYQGWWTHPSGVAFPYLVMDWILGMPLYEWVSQHQPSSRQHLRLLAQLSRVLEATHGADCVHRDVKGHNMLVSPEGDPFLMDFGAGDYKGARTLTHEVLPPSTPQYRSPQALLFERDYRHQPGAHYEAGPADDVYALGVTAYRATTGTYPVFADGPPQDADDPLGPLPDLLRPSALATVCPELDSLILRMLSGAPEARPSASELARALTHAAGSAGPKADIPISQHPRKSSLKRKPHPRSSSRSRVLTTLGIAATVGAAYFTGAAEKAADPTKEQSEVLREERSSGGQSEGTAAVGDSAPLMPVATASQPAPATGLALNMPKRPFAGQRLPPCVRGFEVEIELAEGVQETRSCWFKLDVRADACKLKGYEYKGGCYVPSYPPPKQPQSIQP